MKQPDMLDDRLFLAVFFAVLLVLVAAAVVAPVALWAVMQAAGRCA